MGVEQISSHDLNHTVVPYLPSKSWKPPPKKKKIQIIVSDYKTFNYTLP